MGYIMNMCSAIVGTNSSTGRASYPPHAIFNTVKILLICNHTCYIVKTSEPTMVFQNPIILLQKLHEKGMFQKMAA